MPDPSTHRTVHRAKLLAAGIVLCLLAGMLIIALMRSLQSTALAQAAQVHAQTFVATISASPGGAGLPLTLPGTLQGAIESTIYARSSGYVLRWTKDIGAAVKRGDLLAEISAPEIDQEYSQAVAAEQLAASSASLAQSTADRWQSLRTKDAVTQQELDERLSAYHQAQANLAAARANLARLRNLQGFNKVLAPFDGVVTSRNVDVGDLVDAGNGGAGKALFTIVQVDPLRLYVYVPQAFAAQVKIGDAVTISLTPGGGDGYQGVVARTAGAIDTSTRTMQVEIRVPNPNAALIAGSYVQALLPIRQDSAALIVPTNVLLFRPDGPRIAVVESDHIRLSRVQLGTDFGSTVAVLSGLDKRDRIVVNPPDSLAEGDAVSVAPDQAERARTARGH